MHRNLRPIQYTTYITVTNRYSHDTTATIKPSLSCIASWNRRLQWCLLKSIIIIIIIMSSCVAAFGEVSARVTGTTHNTHKHYFSTSVCKYSNLLFLVFFYKKIILLFQVRRVVTCQMCASRRPRQTMVSTTRAVV